MDALRCWSYVTLQLHYPQACATKAAEADDVAELRRIPVLQPTDRGDSNKANRLCPHSPALFFFLFSLLDARAALSQTLIISTTV